MMRLSSGIPIIAAFLLLPATLPGQESGSISDSYLELGLDPAAVMTLPLGTLESIRGSVPCSPTFAASTSVNLGLSARLGYIFSHDTAQRPFLHGVSFVAGYDDLLTLFLSSPGESFEAYDPVNGRPTIVRTEHTAEFALYYLRAAIQAEKRLAEDLILRAGPSISIPVEGRSRERETILSPENATFLDRTQERGIAEGTGDLQTIGTRIGIGASLAYRLTLGGNLFFEPTIGIDYGLTNVQPAWTPLLIRGGISIGYAFLPELEQAPMPTAVTAPPIVRQDEVRHPIDTPFTADLMIEASPPRIPIEFRRQIVARYVPLLPIIFFDRNASTIPERYAQLAMPGTAPRGGEPESFDETVVSGNPEAAHQQTLNLFGARLRRNPRARVTITGTTSSDEESRAGLADARARAVAEYLASVWGIQRSRMTIRSRINPALPSNSEYPEGRQENRRVELEFTSDDIYRPMQLRSVEPITEPESIPFRTEARSRLGIRRWEIVLTSSDGSTLEQIQGEGLPPATTLWALNNNDRERILSGGTATYALRVFDSVGRSVATPQQRLPIQLDTTVSVASSLNKPDNAAEFLLVTFDFNRADLTRRGRQELQAVLGRIGPGSRVTVIGYTDPVGEQSRNITLAAERARRVASLMPKGVPVEHRGALPDEAPYQSTSPEGRFLSRTVRVVVERPK